jgi:hypothetical protein
MFLISGLKGGREGGRQAERYRVDKAGGCAVDKAG